MNCPKCKSYLKEKTIRTCRIYYCLDCDGIWAAKNIFPRFGEILAFDQQQQYQKIVPGKPCVIQKPSIASSKKICPVCSINLVEFNYAYDSNIFLDRCSKCGGIWADAGEMLQVARHLKPNMDERIIAIALANKPYLQQAERDAVMLANVIQTAVYAIGALASVL